MTREIEQSGHAPQRAASLSGVSVSVILLLLAATLLAGPWHFESPVRPPAEVPRWVTDTTPVRQPALAPIIEIGSFEYRCNDCHALFKSPAETTRQLTQHKNIVLKHGINTRCFNCHHLLNRDAFIDDYGRPIPYDQPQLLCAKCHGPVYRDWLAGSHGRTNGYWNAELGPQQRRKCVECHDPHRPPFPPMTPAPPPQTLRMGTPIPAAHPSENDPLRLRRDEESASAREEHK